MWLSCKLPMEKEFFNQTLFEVRIEKAKCWFPGEFLLTLFNLATTLSN